jgi:hypothetical protein
VAVVSTTFSERGDKANQIAKTCNGSLSLFPTICDEVVIWVKDLLLHLAQVYHR